MARTLLRSKTGCQRCRRRRKKCDERKPICIACRRWNFPCIWTHSDTEPNSSITVASKSSSGGAHASIKWPLTGHGCAGFRDQGELFFLRNFDRVYQSFICPLAGADYADLASFTTVALDEAWSRDAMNAFTSYMLFARTSEKRLEQSSLALYHSAVVSLRQKVDDKLHGKELMSVLMSATFLGLLEGLGTGDASLAIAHFTLVAQLGQRYFSSHLRDASLLPLVRIILEDVVYNLACMSIFHPLPENIEDAIDWIEYDTLFTSYDHELPSYQLSPHFGGNHEFYQLILEVTQFARQNLDQTTRALTVDLWLCRLDFLEERLQSYYSDAPQRVAEMYTAKYQLHAAALRILCWKIKNPELESFRPEILSQVRRAEQIFSRNVLQENHNPALTWPLVVLLYACSDCISFGFFTRQIEVIKLNFGRGHFRNLEAVQSRLHATFEPCDMLTTCWFPDNSRLLLDKDGVLPSFASRME